MYYPAFQCNVYQNVYELVVALSFFSTSIQVRVSIYDKMFAICYV